MSIACRDIKDWITICEIVGGCGEHTEHVDHQVDQDLLWVYDSVRNKWLSSMRFNPGAGRRGRIKNAYLRVMDGQASNLTGWRVLRKATITGIVAQTRNQETWTLRIRKNNNHAIDIVSLAMNNVDGNHSTTIDVDLDEGDQVHMFAETPAFLGIRDPLVWLEIAWRNDNL